jgi:hypothetical protein
MRIPFAAYADDSTVRGEIELASDRLSDQLSAADELQVDGAAFRALDDGHVVETESAAITRDDLCVVTATGPRGRTERRIWTRQYPVRARVGPYEVVGYLHAAPSIDPFKLFYRRAIVPLTESTVVYSIGGEQVRDRAEAVLLNGQKIERLDQVTPAELGLSDADQTSARGEVP